MRPLEGWAREPERLTIADLLVYSAARPADTFDTIGKAKFIISVCVFEKFLGWKWCEDHVFSARNGFLHIDFSDAIKTDTAIIRTIELAEAIFSLQCAPGFAACLDRLKTAKANSEQIEATYAELEFGRVLTYYAILFRFVPTNAGKTPDFEISYPDGLIVAADAKCKLEGSEFTSKTLETSLRAARDKIPKGQVGIAFIKIPQLWAEGFDSRNGTYREAERFMRGTNSISLGQVLCGIP